MALSDNDWDVCCVVSQQAQLSDSQIKKSISRQIFEIFDLRCAKKSIKKILCNSRMSYFSLEVCEPMTSAVDLASFQGRHPPVSTKLVSVLAPVGWSHTGCSPLIG